ncbi:MAG: hypothetical protein ACRC7S_03740 [Cetobacterium sp.]
MRIKKRKRIVKKEIVVNKPRGLSTSVLNPFYGDNRMQQYGKVRRHPLLNIIDIESVKVDNGILMCPSKVFVLTTRVEAYCHSGNLMTDRRMSSLKIEKRLPGKYMSEFAIIKATSPKAFIRWARKQIVPEGTKIIAHNNKFPELRMEYVVKHSKYNASRTLIIKDCIDCVNSMRLRNYSCSYDEIKCHVNGMTVFRKDLGVI